MTILHNEDCFSVDELETNDEIHTASMKISLKDAAAKLSQNNKIQSLIPRADSHYRVKTAPHRLSVLSECSRRHWFETRGGLISAPIMPISEIFAVDDSESSFDGALFGSVVHRIVEIGIPNPEIYLRIPPPYRNLGSKRIRIISQIMKLIRKIMMNYLLMNRTY